MTKEDIWRPLADEIALWGTMGRRPQFWWRDDDAVEPTDALDRLLGLSRRHGAPVALAVIPASTGEALAHRLRDQHDATVLVHGWSHRNHSRAGEKKQELGPHRPAETVIAELSRGQALLGALHGDVCLPVLVPPWNRIDPSLVPHLAGIGFQALSVFGPARPASIGILNSTVDIMDWHGTRSCRDHHVLVGEIVGQLRSARQSGSVTPIGLLTHHLVHDESAWDFLDGLLEVTSDGAEWRSVRDLLAG